MLHALKVALHAVGVIAVPPRPVVARSPQWPAVRRQWLAEHPCCVACGTTRHLEVHHMLPFHLEPARELDLTNLVTMCESPSHNDHFLIGHCLNWQNYNPSVIRDARDILDMLKCAVHA